MSLIKDPAIKIMIEAVYEAETSRQNWDSSWIESVYDQYHKNGGLTEKQLEVLERKYERLQK